MATVEVKDSTGKSVGQTEIADSVIAIEPNVCAVHQVVRSQLAARRQGTHATKGRSEVSGGGSKPWRQKGTGRARQGSIRAAQWKGGGVVFGPTPRSYAFRVPSKMVKLAMRSALSAKYADDQLYVVDTLAFEKPSTKQAAAFLEAFGIDRRVTVIVEDDDTNAILSLRNLPKVRVITVSEANTHDLVDNSAVVLTQAVLKRLEGVLS